MKHKFIILVLALCGAILPVFASGTQETLPTISESNVDTLVLKAFDFDVVFERSGTDRLRIDFSSNSPERYTLHKSFRNGVLNVELKLERRLFDFDVRDSSMVVYLPNNVFVDASSISGRIELSSIPVSGISLSTVSGRIEVRDISADAEIKSTSGRLQIDSYVGQLQASTVSGSIRGSENDIHHGSSLNTVSGRIDIALQGGPDRYTVAYKTVSGRVSLWDTSPDGRSNSTGSGWQKLELSTVSGSIRLN